MMPSSEQLLLDLSPPPPPSLDNFIAGRNGELLHALRALAAAPKERCIYLWGEAGSGRSHLLHALGNMPAASYVDLRTATVESCIWSDEADAPRLWAIDNVEQADADMQIALFNLINEVRAHADAAIVIAGPAAPLQMKLRDDLRSRLGWGLVFQVHMLNDEEKDAALSKHAAERSLNLSTEARQFLLTHYSRDMPTLMALVKALDTYAVQHQRAITLPMLRAYTQQRQAQQQQAGQEQLA